MLSRLASLGMLAPASLAASLALSTTTDANQGAGDRKVVATALLAHAALPLFFPQPPGPIAIVRPTSSAAQALSAVAAASHLSFATCNGHDSSHSDISQSQPSTRTASALADSKPPRPSTFRAGLAPAHLALSLGVAACCLPALAVRCATQCAGASLAIPAAAARYCGLDLVILGFACRHSSHSSEQISPRVSSSSNPASSKNIHCATAAAKQLKKDVRTLHRAREARYTTLRRKLPPASARNVLGVGLVIAAASQATLVCADVHAHALRRCTRLLLAIVYSSCGAQAARCIVGPEK